MPEVLKWKLNFQITEIVAVIGEKVDRNHVGGKIYQDTYILYQVKGVHPVIIHTLPETAAHLLSEVEVHNANEGILNEYGPDYFIQVPHDGNDRVEDCDIKITPTGY